MSADFDKMFTDLIGQTQRAVDGLGPSAEDLEAAAEVVGAAYDDRIRVTMKAGKVTGVDLQPPVRRLELHELSEHLVEAINAAIDANLAALLAQQGDQPDFENLSQQLQSIQAESIRQLNKYTDGMHEVLKNAKELGHG